MLGWMLAFGLSAALAGGDSVAAASASDGTTEARQFSDAERAEYIRLSEEMEKLATRNAWSGVERTYLLLIGTGVPPTFEDYLFGAHAARGLGDVTSARVRLLAANTIREDKQVLDWLWEIDSNYGLVYLAADPGAFEFTAEAMPFEPDAASAVVFAQGRIVETGMFEGYLPQGKYFFGKSEVLVQPRVQATRIDFRTDAGMREQEKKKKKEKKEEGE